MTSNSAASINYLMPSFGKTPALSVFITISFLLLTVNFTSVFAQEEYFFQEEFNQERAAGILDQDKWIVYPNQPTQPTFQGCLVETVRETGGILLLKQCPVIQQFPYVVSKNNPIPSGDFTATVRFQFTGAGGLPSGIKFVDTAPENGQSATEIFGIGFEQDVFQKFVIEYDDTVVFTKNTDSGFYIFKAVKEGNVYKLFLNDQLVFTSPETSEKVRAIYMGNPAVLPSPGYNWSWPRIDYIRVVDDGPSQVAPEPFLILPWKYSDSGKDFKQIAFNPNSWFDHKYPLQNYGCCAGPIVDYKGETKDKAYRSHNGYDYGSSQGVDKHTLVRAAATGSATLKHKDNSGGYGNMIKIDHGNGYQTWYAHLEEATAGSELKVKEEGKSEEVKQGEVIGRVGLTGNTTGYHIHFSVIRDLDENGNFDEDKLFGLVDPLGWEGDYADPWEEYSVTDENDVTRNGAKSYKLFIDLAPPKTQQLPQSGGTITSDEFNLNVPPNGSNGILNFKIEDGPFEKSSGTIKSIVPSLFLSATDSLGQIVTNFNNPLGLIYDYSKADLSNINEDTISFYFFNTGTNLWEKLSGNLDKTNKTISSETTHFSQFAVMGELLDTTPPTTNAELIGNKGTGNWYRSNVTVKLLAEDNPGGKGVSYAVYSLDGEHWNEYTEPLEFTEDKSYKISFLSHDNVDNTEEIKTIEFSIDKTIPEAKIEVDLTDYDLKITPISNDPVEITKKSGKKKFEYIYTLTDQAGNTLALETYDLDQKNIDIFKLFSLKYNSEPLITLPNNIIDTNYIFQIKPKINPSIRIINQNFNLKDKQSLRSGDLNATFVIVADVLKNKTFLNIIENKKPRKEEKPGIVLLKLQTNKGKLEYSY